MKSNLFYQFTDTRADKFFLVFGLIDGIKLTLNACPFAQGARCQVNNG
jgi:hypothetical protein